jgi:hypothetical protein
LEETRELEDRERKTATEPLGTPSTALYLWKPTSVLVFDSV